MFEESKRRSLLKMISWRVWATLTTMTLVFIFVGKIAIAFSVGFLEVIIKMALYYLHERFWDKIMIGKKQIKPFVLWFTGLPCSGKSTLADMAYDDLSRKNYKVERLDGDVVRSIFPSTGYSKEERNSHIKRISYLASMLEKNGVIVICSFVSPYRETREFARDICDNLVEVYVSTPLEECIRRDVKGMYKKAMDGEIENFTGVSDPYEPPESPHITVDTEKQSTEESYKKIEKYIKRLI